MFFVPHDTRILGIYEYAHVRSGSLLGKGFSGPSSVHDDVTDNTRVVQK